MNPTDPTPELDLDDALDIIFAKTEVTDPTFVRRLIIDHRTLTLETFAKGPTGHKFIGADGAVALELAHWPIKTYHADVDTDR